MKHGLAPYVLITACLAVCAVASEPAAVRDGVPHTQTWPHTVTVADLQLELRHSPIDFAKLLAGVKSFLASNPSASQSPILAEVSTALRAQHSQQEATEQEGLKQCNDRLSTFIARSNQLIGAVHTHTERQISAHQTVIT